MLRSLAVLAILALASTAHAAPTFFAGTGNTYDEIDGSFTWDAARLDAIAKGGHLATIESEAENAFLFDLPGGSNRWIGLNDIAVEGTFVWVTGEPVVFTKFGAGEPNNVGNEDAVHMRGDPFWNDLPVTSQLGYFLEIEARTGVPLPATVLLVGLGLVGVRAVRWATRR